MGLSLISFRGERWRGRTTLTTNDRGDKRLVRIKNGLISSDGSEIRSFPGWRTLFDFSPENNSNGYERYVWDTVLPVFKPVPGLADPTNYYEYIYRREIDLSPDFSPDLTVYTLKCRAKPVHLHFFEQVDDRVIIAGETRFREAPMIDSPGEPWLNVVSIGVILDSPSWKLYIIFDGEVGAYGANAHSYNGIVAGDPVFIDSLTVSGEGNTSATPAATIQALLDARINGCMHQVDNVSGNTIRLTGDYFGDFATVDDWAVSDGEVHKIRANYNNTYWTTPKGLTPYHGDEFSRVDDPDALTSWRINPELPFSIGNCCSHTVYPAYVANRQRDHSDDADRYIEGYQPTPMIGSQTGISRREQRRLPYRMVPEPAGNRIIIAAPGYNCLFQIPLLPINPQNWPNTPDIEGQGLEWFENDVYDKPRALGVPKARIVESLWTPAPASPGETGDDNISHMIVCLDLAGFISNDYTWPEGTYRMCVTYYDDVTGEEGQPSEVVEFTIPAVDTPTDAYAVKLTYYHPGYVMPECLALKMRIYLSDDGGEVMGLYKTIPLRDDSGFAYLGQGGDDEHGSAKYGFYAGENPIDTTPRGEEWRSTYLPIPFTSPQTVSDRIDFSRPPLQSNSMPRGASSARYIRGTLISVGHAGVDASSVSQWPGWGSLVFDTSDDNWDLEDQILIRVHGESAILPGDGPTLSGFGVAARFFPDAYQGIEIAGGRMLFATMQQSMQIDKILNHASHSIDGRNDTHIIRTRYERLKMTSKVFDSDLRRGDGSAVSDAPVTEGREFNKQFFYKLFKGQVQIGDPGNPWRVTKAGGRGIQFMDPNKDDDGVAVFQFAGNAVICTRKETYFLSWHRDAAGEIPTTINTDFGCIAPNSGAEFDGGLVWLSERGPVALGASLQFVGLDIEQDFVGSDRRYLTDSKGMMRHSWSCHDAARGQVYFGLITTDATHMVARQMGTVAVTSATDEELSRAPCNEILCWSYRTGSFTYWNPPSGLEVLWMRPIRMATDDNGTSFETRIAMLNADGRIRVLDDRWQDENAEALETTAANKGSSTTSLTLAATSWGIDGNGGDTAREDGTGDNILLRAGQRIEAFDADGNIEWATTIASADPDTDIVILAEAQSWAKGQAIRIGTRPAMEVETTFVGSETAQNLDTDAVQVRYTLHGDGKANVDCYVLKSDLETTTAAKQVDIRHRSLGEAAAGERHGRRRQLHGKAAAPEMAVKLVIAGEPQVRIVDIALEI